MRHDLKQEYSSQRILSKNSSQRIPPKKFLPKNSFRKSSSQKISPKKFVKKYPPKNPLKNSQKLQKKLLKFSKQFCKKNSKISNSYIAITVRKPFRALFTLVIGIQISYFNRLYLLKKAPSMNVYRKCTKLHHWDKVKKCICQKNCQDKFSCF